MAKGKTTAPKLNVGIDPDDLESNLLDQPRQVYDWSMELARVTNEAAEADTNLKLAKAAADKAIRADPAAYDLAKATEATVAAAVLEHPEVVQAMEDLNSAHYAVGIVRAAVDALQDRKRSLTLLVELRGQQYFSEKPITPRGVRGKGRRRD